MYRIMKLIGKAISGNRKENNYIVYEQNSLTEFTDIYTVMLLLSYIMINLGFPLQFINKRMSLSKDTEQIFLS